VGVLNREEFDEIEFEAAGSGDHATAARRMIKLAVTGTQTESMPRSEAFLRAGEQWLLADDPAAAENGFRLAIADGGPVFSDPRVPLTRALFLLGRSAEAQSLLDELKAERPQDPRICDLVAELLVEIGDLAGALDLATAGVELCLQRRPGRTAESGAAGGTGERGAAGGTAESGAAGGTGESGAAGGTGNSAAADGTRDGARVSGAPDEAAAAGAPGGARVSPGADPEAAEAELQLLLRLRYRIRNDLGLPEDHYDALLDDS
jgi:hypothetical protein